MIPVLLIALVAAIASGAEASVARERIVPCSESIDGTKFPYSGGGYRLVLGAVSAPPAYHAQIIRSGTRAFPYFFKAGLVVRAGRQAVVVSVPAHWRDRAAIAWGYGGNGVFSSLLLRGCAGLPTQGFAYSGGFFLRPRSACLPLLFRVGNRRTIVRFGLGRRCP